MLRLALVQLVFLLASCSTTPAQKIFGPNGKEAYLLECYSGLENCYTDAHKECQSGWTILDRTSSTIGVPVYGGGSIITTTHQLVIQCKTLND